MMSPHHVHIEESPAQTNTTLSSSPPQGNNNKSILRQRGTVSSQTSVSRRNSNVMAAKLESSKFRVSKVCTSRLIFLVGLAAVGALLSYGAYRLLSESEQSLAENVLAAISDRALDTALEVTLRKRLGAKSVATVAAHAFPDASQWPFVYLNGFADISSAVLETAAAYGTVGLAPLVKPAQLTEFTNYIHQAAWGDSGETFQDFQVHVTGFDESNSFARYNETDGITRGWDSSNTDIWPYTMHSSSKDILLFNLHSLERFGAFIEEMQTCAAMHDKNNIASLDLTQCATMTDIVVGFNKNGSPRGPSAFIYQPIYPANDPAELVGFISLSMDWNKVMEKLFSAEVSGVDCVLATETTSFTYHVINGIAEELGYGDLHQPEFTKHGKSISLYSPELFGNSSVPYTLTLYPSDEIFEVYSTRNPVIALVGAFCIVLFTAVLYLLYDYFVQEEFHHKAVILEAKRQYMRFISHEVRTPLNAVVMGSSLIQDDLMHFLDNVSAGTTTSAGITPAEGETAAVAVAAAATNLGEQLQDKLRDWSHLTSDVLTSAQSAVHVLNDLLNYDKIESGTLHLEWSHVPIWDLIQQTTTEFQLSARAKRISMELEFDNITMTDKQAPEDLEVGNQTGCPTMAKDLWVIGDTIRLAQVLRNYLSNAVKFTPEGGNIWVRASFKSSPTDTATPSMRDFTLASGEQISVSPRGSFRVDVTDSGAGMSPEQVSGVFQEGVQFNVNELQAGQGSGLGLYIAHGIVVQHEGYLEVASEGLGHGTTFTLTLPLYHVPESDLPECTLRTDPLDISNEGDSAAPCAALNASPLEKYRILVVDDIEMNRRLLLRLLQRKGHVCDQADDGDTAVLAVKRAMEAGDRYDTILLDYEMPRMKGTDAAKELRDLGCDSTIVGVTGNTLPEDVHYFKSCGANAVLPKPLNVKDLEDVWAYRV